jgi:ribose-phosphate pyrophosphokinase
MDQDFLLFSGTANPPLAAAVASALGVAVGRCASTRFPDGEVDLRLEESVRGRDVFLVQPTGPPVNENLVELFAFADACRRAAAARVTAVVPYFGYARSDKRHGRRSPITASLIAQLMQTAGIDQVLTLDLHSTQIEGFFGIPVDDLTAVPLLAHALRDRLPDEVLVVSPDTGRVAMAADYAHRLGTSVIVLHKRRTSGTETHVTRVIGDVQDRSCLIIDDMISTGGTIAQAVEALLAAGARPDFTVAASHGLFVCNATMALSHKAIREVVVTDSVAVDRSWPRVRVVSIAPLLAAAIQNVLTDGSLGNLRHDIPTDLEHPRWMSWFAKS